MLTKDRKTEIFINNRRAIEALKQSDLSSYYSEDKESREQYSAIYKSLMDIDELVRDAQRGIQIEYDNLYGAYSNLLKRHEAIMEIIRYMKECQFCRYQRDCNHVKTVGECAQEWEFGIPEKG